MQEVLMFRSDSLTFAKCLSGLADTVSLWLFLLGRPNHLISQILFDQALLNLEHQSSEDHCRDEDQGEGGSDDDFLSFYLWWHCQDQSEGNGPSDPASEPNEHRFSEGHSWSMSAQLQ